MDDRLSQLRSEFQDELKSVKNVEDWSALRDKYLGRKGGLISTELKRLGSIEDPEERAAYGKHVNELSSEVDKKLIDLKFKLARLAEEQALGREKVDISLPGTKPGKGHLHPVSIVRRKIEDIFVSMGYMVEDGPEIETSFFNFDALNISPNHPARDSADTFYAGEELALRTQTSTVQIHTMQRCKPPLRIIAPGRVFRRDTPDPTHNPMFFQVEGLNVDRRITMGDLKGTLDEFVRRMFGAELKTRFRPSYFPFTEPSAEVDFNCFICSGSGCRMCKGSGWIELGGSGMVHPNVLEAVGIDSENYTGFAFGLGIDRMVALMFGIADIRLLYENDVRFLEQFY